MYVHYVLGQFCNIFSINTNAVVLCDFKLMDFDISIGFQYQSYTTIKISKFSEINFNTETSNYFIPATNASYSCYCNTAQSYYNAPFFKLSLLSIMTKN